MCTGEKLKLKLALCLKLHWFLSSNHSQDLRKPLKVRFVGGGEQGLDLGGVQKELFQVIFRHICDPNYSLFEEDADNRALWPSGMPVWTDVGKNARWIKSKQYGRMHMKCSILPTRFSAAPSVHFSFTAHSKEPIAKYELIGMLLGLALFNNIALGLNFPPPFYKALLGHPRWTLRDLADVRPTLAKSLQALLDYEGDDVEDVFALSFAVTERWVVFMRSLVAAMFVLGAMLFSWACELMDGYPSQSCLSTLASVALPR